MNRRTYPKETKKQIFQTYKDGLRHHYNVPADRLEAFEKRRTILLTIAIVAKVGIIVALVFAANFV